jgi:23S rRNA pseudouridine2605 synthase
VAPDLLRITIHEGRNRQVRRMCEAIGHPVVRLVRTRIGPISDPKLQPGAYRVLDNDELLELQRAVSGSDSASPTDDASAAERVDPLR